MTVRLLSFDFDRLKHPAALLSAGVLKTLVMWISVFVFVVVSSKAYSEGQEANMLFGGMATDRGKTSWAFQVEYKQVELLKYKDLGFDGSFSYVNEGHPTGHYRDGVVVQGWAGLLDRFKLHLSLGAGPYLYNDTVSRHAGTNGLGCMTSFDVRYDVSKNFSVGARLNEALVPQGPNATSLLFEVGYRLPDKEQRPAAEPKNQISFLTLAFSDNISDLGTFSELRFARAITDHIDVVAANFFGRGFKEKGGAAEACATNEFGNFKTGICAGPYHEYQKAETAGIASLFGDYNLKNTPWSVMVIFDRTSNFDNHRGIDATSLGVGYKF
jgi:hypothetical protein